MAGENAAQRRAGDSGILGNEEMLFAASPDCFAERTRSSSSTVGDLRKDHRCRFQSLALLCAQAERSVAADPSDAFADRMRNLHDGFKPWLVVTAVQDAAQGRGRDLGVVCNRLQRFIAALHGFDESPAPVHHQLGFLSVVIASPLRRYETNARQRGQSPKTASPSLAVRPA